MGPYTIDGCNNIAVFLSTITDNDVFGGEALEVVGLRGEFHDEELSRELLQSEVQLSLEPSIYCRFSQSSSVALARPNDSLLRRQLD